MNGILLAIDPGQVTGWAMIDIETEKVLLFGEVKTGDQFYISQLGELMEAADLLIVEDQYLDKNVDSTIKLAALRGGIEMLWAVKKHNKTLGINCLAIKPPKWQTALNIPTKARRWQRKRASMFQAKALTGQKLSQDVSDAVCMGVAIARRLKAKEKIREAEEEQEAALQEFRDCTDERDCGDK